MTKKRKPLSVVAEYGPITKIEPITAQYTPDRWIKEDDFYPPLAPGHYRLTTSDGTEERIQILESYRDVEEIKTRRIFRGLGT